MSEKIPGTIISVNHNRLTCNPIRSNGLLVASIKFVADDGRICYIDGPVKSHTGAGKRISVSRDAQGEWIIDSIETLNSIEMFPWLGADFDAELGKFTDVPS